MANAHACKMEDDRHIGQPRAIGIDVTDVGLEELNARPGQAVKIFALAVDQVVDHEHVVTFLHKLSNDF
jgi:hypothetical protein